VRPSVKKVPGMKAVAQVSGVVHFFAHTIEQSQTIGTTRSKCNWDPKGYQAAIVLL
jgi:hypothetical protein